MDSSIVEVKGNIFIQLWHLSPALPVVFSITLILAIIGISIIIIAIKKPGFFNKALDKLPDKKIKLENGDVINDRRKGKRRQEDKKSAPCLTAKCSKYEQLSDDITEIKNRMIKVEEHQDEVWLMNLKRDFYSKDLPEHDRLLGGLKYVWWVEKQGLQNGSTKSDVITMAYEKYSLYSTATTLDPRLKISEVEERI
jgi:hypothetical protein